MAKTFVWTALAIMIGFSMPAGVYFLNNYFKVEPAEVSAKSSAKNKEREKPARRIRSAEPVTITFVGDIMLDRGVQNSVERNFSGDYDGLFTAIRDLKKGDILFGNLEGPMSDKGDNVGSIYSFRMKPIALSALVRAGFDVLSVANNHAGDWNYDAFVDTIHRLKEVGIKPTGGGMNLVDAKEPTIIEVNGTKVGFLAFSDVGPNWLEAQTHNSGILLVNDNFAEIIKSATLKTDVLIVSIHFGNEYEKIPSDRQKFLAKGAVDAGAKIVAGHHPHVIQPVEEYKNGLIAYSLGNFIFDQYFSDDTLTGLVLDVTVDENRVISHSSRQTKQDGNFVPHFLP